MKTKNLILVATFLLLLFSSKPLIAQEEAKKPMYVTVTTMHWNMDYENFDMDTWKSVEKEYMDKVTRKNEHVIGAGFYMHYFTADNTELIYVQSYESWDAMNKASKRGAELTKEAWPDEASRKAYLEKRDDYYSNMHSDEIYATMDGAKPFATMPTKDMVVYVRKSHFAFPKDGSKKEFDELRAEHTANVFHKNDLIKAYFPNEHAWGSDKTEFVEAFYLDSLDELDDMLEKNGELFKAHWPDEEKRKAYNKKASKYFTGVHGDYIYTYVSGI